MAWIIVFKQHGALNCEQQFFGPFAQYSDAEAALCDGRVPTLYGQGGRPWPKDIGDECSNGHRYVQQLTEPGAPNYCLRFPMLLAVCLQMDCSGGPVYDTPQAFEDQVRAMLMGPWQLCDLREAEHDLARFTGNQLEWIALGGKASDQPMPDCEVVTPAPPSATTEAVLKALYE